MTTRYNARIYSVSAYLERAKNSMERTRYSDTMIYTVYGSDICIYDGYIWYSLRG
jgi:hypothetical protein